MKTATRVLAALFLAAAGCQEAGPTYSLKHDDRDELADRRRRLMNVTIVSDDGQGNEQTQEVDNFDFAGMIAQECTETIGNDPGWQSACNADLTTPQTCDEAVCQVQLSLCVVHRLLDFASLVQPEELVEPGQLPVTVPPQSTATNAGLRELAVWVATMAATRSGENLRSAAQRPDAEGVCTMAELQNGVLSQTISYEVALAEALAETTHLLRESGEGAAEDNLAAADAARSSEPNLGDASRAVWTAPVLSRAHVAHVFGGGDEGLRGLESTGVCDIVSPPAAVKGAIETLRVSGADLDDLTGSMDLDTLFTAAPSGAIRDRLAELWSTPELSSKSTDEILGYLGLEREHMLGAREYLRREQIAFARSSDAKLPFREITTGPLTYDMFAATTQPPTPPPDSYYALLARHTATPLDERPPNYAEQPLIPTPSYADRGLAQALDYSASVSFDLIAAAFDPKVKDVLAAVASDGADAREARAELCYMRAQGLDTVRIRLMGSDSSDPVRLVTGTDGLRCAIEGHIEAGECTLADYLISASPFSNAADPQTGFESYLEWGFDPSWAEDTDVYLVRLRDPGAQEAAGSFEEITGLRVTLSQSDTGGWWYCNSTAVIPEVDEAVADALTPSPSICSRPAETCAGLPFDQRLPLEDELSDDGDMYESSWRHYLDLADQAATEADLLGEQLIAHGLEMDLRAEAAIEELQGICGATISIDDLASDDLSDIHAGPCSGGTCDPGYVCMRGECVRDPVDSAAAEAATAADAHRIKECLGDDATYAHVSLGSSPLCIWHDNMNENEICADATADSPCPYVAPASGSCTAPPGHTPVLVDEQVAFFEDDTVAGSEAGRRAPCEEVRRLRNPDFLGDRGDEFARLVGEGFFDPTTVRAIAERLGWEARPGDYSALTIDGAPWYETGDIDYGTTSDWPCGGGPPASCGGDEVGLFCEPFGAAACSTNAGRAAINDRFARAYMAARLTAGLGLENASMPRIYYGIGQFGTLSDRTIPGGTLRYGDVTAVGSVEFKTPLPVGYCTVGGTVPLWTAPATGVVLTPGCLDPGASDPFLVKRQVAPKPLGDFGILISGVLWSGVGGRPRTYGAGAYDEWVPLYADLLSGDGTTDLDRVEIGPGTHSTLSSLTAYWSSSLDDVAVAPEGLTRHDLLDGMELVCQAASSELQCDLEHPPPVSTPADLSQARSYLHCLAASVEQMGQRIVFTNMPQRVVDALREGGATGTYPAVGGENGAQIAALHAALIEMSTTPGLIATEVRHLSNDLERLRIGLARIDVSRDIADLNLEQVLFNNMSSCGMSIASSVVSPSPAGFGSSLSSCANSLAQINFATQLNDLTHKQLDLDSDEALLEFRDRWASRAETLNNLATQLSAAQAQINSTLARLESLRRKGRRALHKALFLDSGPGGEALNVNTVMRRRLNTDRIRYEEARDNAIRMTYLAKLAVEQRLGMRLADMHDGMSLVPAPSRWESELCTMTGIDYDRIRTAGALPDDNYADAYIGDYVTRLRNLVESYRLDFPFQNSEDTSVISLRDEIHNARSSCEVEVENLLPYAADLEVTSEPRGSAPGWAEEGCTDPPAGEPYRNCVGVEVLTDPADRPFTPFNPELGEPRGYRLTFGLHPSMASCDPPCRVDATLTDTAWTQPIDLTPGRYRLSWYGRAVSGSTLIPSTAVTVRHDTSTVELGAVGTWSFGTDWTRYYRFMDVAEAQTVRIAVEGPLVLSEGEQIDVAAFMLEDVTGLVVGDEGAAGSGSTPTLYDPDEFPPGPFVATDDDNVVELPVCEDTTGDVFRSTAWRRGCLRLCAEGYGRSCADGEPSASHCYWETEFTIRQRDIERGRLIRSGGFAQGNYNYRTDSLALNFVGTATRDCSESLLPSGCYSAAYIPYTLEHRGPYTVRNHLGEDYDAPLFDGRIEHGRGLAAERYVTNPMSSADAMLIEPFMHREFRGRPLDGTYLLRVWETEGVNFSAIEDVQIVLNYRYWTRFE